MHLRRLRAASSVGSHSHVTRFGQQVRAGRRRARPRCRPSRGRSSASTPGLAARRPYATLNCKPCSGHGTVDPSNVSSVDGPCLCVHLASVGYLLPRCAGPLHARGLLSAVPGVESVGHVNILASGWFRRCRTSDSTTSPTLVAPEIVRRVQPDKRAPLYGLHK